LITQYPAVKKVIFWLLAIIWPLITAEVLLGYGLWMKKSGFHSSVHYVIRNIGNKIYPFFTPDQNSISFSPKSMYIPDEYLGYANVPGKYEVTITHKPSGRYHTFRVTIDENGNRITSNYDQFFKGKEEIWIFGDSFTNGYGNNDETTFPFILQAMLPNFHIVNYSSNGYGDLHAYLQLRRLKKEKNVYPRTIVITYGDYYRVRNVPAPSRLKDFSYDYNLVSDTWKGFYPSKFLHPKVVIEDNGKLTIEYIPLFCEFSNICKQSDPDERTLVRTTEIILESIYEIGRSMGSKMILAFIAGKDKDEIVSYALGIGYKIADIRPSEKRYEMDRLLPFDGHPGPLAQNYFAIKMREVICSEDMMYCS
jgi:hypothetical protein